jgi:hypothetical protein
MVAPVQTDSFSLQPTYEPPKLVVKFSGTGDLDAVDALAGFLPQIHQACGELAASEVVFDFRGLTFMNSSCFKGFVTFIDQARGSNAGYRIRFITSGQHHWQRRSLEALRRLAMGVVTIQPEN